jgi:hypothetical protein
MVVVGQDPPYGVARRRKKESSMALEVPTMPLQAPALPLEVPVMLLKGPSLPQKGATMALQVPTMEVRTRTRAAFFDVAAVASGIDAEKSGSTAT